MRKIISTITMVLIGLQVCLADKIVTRAADIIECLVTQITDTSVKYRKGNENFEREIPRGDVFKIKYDNGEEESFNQDVKASQLPQSSLPLNGNGQYQNTETEPDWDSFAPASRQYHIGDWYSENGVEGIVVWTTPDGRHGRIVHKKTFNNAPFKKPVAFFTGPIDVPIGMNDIANGYANLIALRRFMEANPQYTPEMFPVQKIIDNLGAGWYLPAVKELEYFELLRETSVTYNGENSKFNGKTVQWHKIFNYVSKQHGGDKHHDFYRLSSTEVYSPGGASATFETLYGDPQHPQFALIKLATGEPQKPVVRDRGLLPFFAFHLF